MSTTPPDPQAPATASTTPASTTLAVAQAGFIQSRNSAPFVIRTFNGAAMRGIASLQVAAQQGSDGTWTGCIIDGTNIYFQGTQTYSNYNDAWNNAEQGFVASLTIVGPITPASS